MLTGAASLTASDTAASPVGTYPITAALGTLSAKNYIFAFTPGTLTITQAGASAYTITWPSQSIVYGTAIGGATGIKASASIAGSFTYSPAGVLPVSATAVAVTATFTPTDSVDYAGQSATASITVTPATLTVAANNATRAFAAPDPSFTDTITGYVNGDTAAVLTGAASLTASDTAASPVGTYPITAALGTLTAKNYIFAFTPGTLTITQAGASAYTITWPSQSIVYGTAIGGATGIKASASIAGSFTYSPAGVLPVSATAVAVTATFTPTDSVDYAGQSATASITVTPATLTVAANNATRAFAAPDPSFTDTITGYVNGDTAAVLTGAAGLTASDTAASPVGTYPITAALGTLTAKNYIFAFTPGTLTITQAGASAYTITWPSQSIVYGTAIGGATGIKASASIAGSFTYSPAGVLPVSATAVAVTATFTPTDSVDYAGQSATAGITVTPATLTVAANNATRAFAAPDPGFTASITGYVNGDTAAVLTGAASLTASDTAASPVGTYPITAALGSLTAKNYIFAFTPGTLTITQAGASAYTITWPSQSIVYGTAIGGATGIKASASIAGSFTYSPAGVLPVSATAVAVTATFTPTDSVDYAGQSATASITVTPATLTVAANNAARAFAAPDPGFTASITGYVNGDTAAVLTGAASLTASDTAASPVGTYPITAALGTLTAKNYIFAFTPGTLTITQAGASAYTITWPSQSIVYGTAIGGATGIKASASIAGSFTYSPAGVLPVSATAVAVTATFTPTDSVDYAGQSATASITVTPATLTVAANNATRAFAAPDPGFTDTITGFVNGDTDAVLTGAASLTASDTAASPVGTYPITAALGTLTAKNYIFAFTPGTLTITQAGASAYTITWPSQSIVYGTAIGGATGIKASASIAGSFTYSPAGVLPVSATAVAVTATFTPTRQRRLRRPERYRQHHRHPGHPHGCGQQRHPRLRRSRPRLHRYHHRIRQRGHRRGAHRGGQPDRQRHRRLPGRHLPHHRRPGHSHGQELHLRLHPRHPHHHPGRRQRLLPSPGPASRSSTAPPSAAPPASRPAPASPAASPTALPGCFRSAPPRSRSPPPSPPRTASTTPARALPPASPSPRRPSRLRPTTPPAPSPLPTPASPIPSPDTSTGTPPRCSPGRPA